MSVAGRMDESAAAQLAELKIPAREESIRLAKRVATSLGGQVGFSLDEIDELAIAVSQSCSSLIEAVEEMWGGEATLRLVYSLTNRGRGIAVEFEALAPGSAEALRLPPPGPARPAGAELERALRREMIRLFVDDFRHQVNLRERHIRYRVVKYLVS
jgi:hypothetical protein